MIKQLSSYSVGTTATSVSGARSGSEDSRSNQRGFKRQSAHEVNTSSRSMGERGQTNGDGDGAGRPGMFRQISTSLMQSGRAMVRRNSFTGLASGDSSASTRGRNRGDMLGKQGSHRSSASVGVFGGGSSGKEPRRRSFSFENFNLVHSEPSTERDILEAKVQDRDEQVKHLEHDKRENEENMKEFRSEFDDVKRQRLQDEHLRKLQIHRLKREHKAMTARVKVFKRDMHDKESLHGYAELIKGAAPTAVDSSYIMRLQSQLSKAIKKMEAMEGQMNLVQETCEEVLVSLNEEIGDVIDEKCKVQVEMQEQVDNIKKERAAMEKKFQDELAKEEEKHKKLLEKENNINNPDVKEEEDDGSLKDDEEETQGIDDEINKIKKELSQLVNEKEKSERALRSAIRKKKEEIARMQQLTELQGESLCRLELESE